MQKERVCILAKNSDAQRVVASSARISTQAGSALEIYANGEDGEKNIKLIRKVLSSGHKSVLEHQNFSIAFDGVSVLVEQFVIEFRLASYTVKSRRYVDFSDAGYVTPADMADDIKMIYEESVQYCFDVYKQLIDMGIPKEDARFVLPYGFRSNFFVTVNARELVNMIIAMVKGRGSVFAELKQIGCELKKQLDELYPEIMDAELKKAPEEVLPRLHSAELKNIEAVTKGSVELVNSPEEGTKMLRTAMLFSNRFAADMEGYRSLVKDARPRELEVLQYSFFVDDLSLACLTHFTRHRMLSIQTRPIFEALANGKYILPESVKANSEAEKIYCEVFEKQKDMAEKAQRSHATCQQLSYFALAGHTTSIMISMNARELLHFAKLRTCTRAQWEIRIIAREMMHCLCNTEAGELFKLYGPTCMVVGKCPEGKMTCGHPVTSLFD